MVTQGVLSLNNGSIAGGTVEARGDLIIANTFDGGTNAVTFSGPAAQTFTNNGSFIPSGIWTINKPSGTVTATSSLILPTTQTLNITSGTLYLNNNSNLTTGALNIGINGKLVNDSATIVTLGGNVSNEGLIDFRGGGANCPETDSILIRSSGATQRSWNGGGRIRLVDVDVQTMSGTATKTVFNGTNGGGNNASWIFDNNCPILLSISPSSASVQTGGTQTFTAAGGSPNYTFSIFTNNSGATINPATRVYTAGTTAGVTDTVRVSDAFGATADATVSVSGAASKLGFIVQPSNTNAGQIITPAIQVAVQDQSGNTITNSSAEISIAIQPNPGGGTLSGTAVKNAQNGIAVFDDLSVNGLGADYTLRTTSGGLTVATSAGFNVTTGAASRLAFVVQPSNTTANAVTTPGVQVAIQDSNGNTVTTAIGTITIAIGANPNGGALSGTAVRNAVNGIAAFHSLSINKAGDGYTLTAASGSLTGAVSSPFNIISPFVVTNTDDSGAGSLRHAITTANNTPGIQTISFNVATGTAPFTITLSSALPIITQPLVVDGTTQPGYSGSPMIELRPSVIGSTIGLYITGGGSTIRGLVLNRFDQGIDIGDSDGNVIQGNYIGTNATGSAALPNRTGIIILGSSNNLIGGPTASERNIISGNLFNGIILISNNNTVQGNFIGTNADGTAAIGNTDNGISLVGNNNSIINNVISGNATSGISVTANSNLIQNNIIGLDAGGTNPLGNGHQGILFTHPSIRGVRLTGNRIFANGRLGIQLRYSVTNTPPLPNDPQDADTGANSGQNYPVLTAAFSSGAGTTITGSLNSTPSSTFTTEFFSSPSCDASGNGEGETFLGSGSITTDAGGIGGFTATLPVAVASGRFVTATAKDASGNTSEFSQCRIVNPVHIISGQITKDGQPIKNVQVILTGGKRPLSTLTNSNGEYLFDKISAGGNYTVTLVRVGLVFSPASKTFNNLGANQINQNFAAARPNFTISGQTRSTFAGTTAALGGVTVTLSNGLTRLTHTNGDYTFNNVPAGNYTLTATKANYLFVPPAYTFTSLNSNQTASFNAQPNPALSGRVAYVDVTGLSIMNANGSAVVKLSNSAVSPSISPNGIKIAFIQSVIVNSGPTTAGAANRVFTINFDGTNQQMITPAGSSNVNESSPVWSADGTKLAFARKVRQGASSIQVINLSTSNETSLASASDVLNVFGGLRWSPDGAKIAYEKRTIGFFSTGTSEIRVVNSNGSGSDVLLAASAGRPSWSPDGANIVYEKRLSNSSQIAVGNSDGSGSQAVIATSAGKPSFSPDGAKIAFIKYPSASQLSNGQIALMDADGTNVSILPNASTSIFADADWSPDGAYLAFDRTTSPTFGVISADGLTIVGIKDVMNFDWGTAFAPLTLPGIDVNIIAGAISITFSQVSGAEAVTNFSDVSSPGQTTVIPIPPNAAGTIPNGFVIGSFGAYEISTTANVTPPITVCFTVPSVVTQARFNQIVILYNEGGTLVPKTTIRDFPNHRVCASVNSLSPFVIAEQVDAALPGITGLAQDAVGNPLSDVGVKLTGAENRTTITDSDGFFAFPNLTAGANYSVQPTQVGYLFEEYNQDFVNLSGENSVVFTGVANNFQIDGRIVNANGDGISGVTISLDGAAQETLLTDANGVYSFTNLPADGLYIVTPSHADSTFNPPEHVIENLTSNLTAVNFTESAALPPPTPGVEPGQVIISEFRLRGPAGSADDFIELYNNSGGDITVSTGDGSNGWLLVSSTGAVATLLNGTVIPARGHFLFTGSAYSLNSSAAGDAALSSDVTDGGSIALFRTGILANAILENRLDATGFASSPELLREGAGLGAPVIANAEHSFVRRLNTGSLQDTGDNAQDFVLVSTTDPALLTGAVLGGPGPENTSSPLQRNATIKSSLIDPQCAGFGSPGSACARVRTAQGANPQNAAFGTLLIRRKFRNTSPDAVTRLRFRLVNITTLGNTQNKEADLRALTSVDVTVTDTNNASVEIKGLTLEDPPPQPEGGGLNSTLAAGTIDLSNRLAPGAPLNVEFRLGVMRDGAFRFFVNVEASSVPVAAEAPATNGKGMRPGSKSKPRIE